MEPYIRYVLITTTCMSIFYMLYHGFLKKDRNFKFLRFYLLLSLVFSMILPFNKFSLENLGIQQFVPTQIIQLQDAEFIDLKSLETEINPSEKQKVSHLEVANQPKSNTIQFNLLSIYLTISSLFFFRFLFSTFKILNLYFKSPKSIIGNFTILKLDKTYSHFSFFSWIFIDKSIHSVEESQILEHEKIHATQFHSIDNLFLELLIAFMWFNPFVWLYKNSIQQVHEFLADEGAIKSGIRKSAYKALLINQIAQNQLITMTSQFSYSSIKSRIMKLSETNTSPATGIKKYLLIPIALLLFLTVSAFNAGSGNQILQVSKTSNEIVISYPDRLDFSVQNQTGTKHEIAENTQVIPIDTIPKNTIKVVASPTKMNVLYLGVDNPVSIAADGISTNQMEVSIDNGSISGKNGNYIARPIKYGIATIKVSVKDKGVSLHEFRVKRVPNPSPFIPGAINNEISAKELLKAGRMDVSLENFDFDLKFEISEFVMIKINGEEVFTLKQDKGGNFTPEQIEKVKTLKPGDKVLFLDIVVACPDGSKRNIDPILYKIK